MSNNKQSSIEWLMNQISDYLQEQYGIDYFDSKLLEQAKAMHKEEIVKAWSNGYDEDDRATSSPLKYYNETYK